MTKHKIKIFLFAFTIIFSSFQIHSQDIPLLKLSENKLHILTQNNQPFFWLGGTAWELIHRLNREEVELYFKDRANKGFTIIQTVILAELDGLTTPNAYGHLPLLNNDPTKFNEKYFEHVDYIIQLAAQHGLYIGLLPTWGDKFHKKWGVGPEIFTKKNAKTFGKLLAKRYKNNNNIIWVLGGDRIPEKPVHFDIINAMAKGIRKQNTKHLISYHPMGPHSASEFFNKDWLDIDMFQSGHSRISKEYNHLFKNKNNIPPRPIINGEARYENIRDRFWEKEKHEWMDDSDVRVSAYWSMLSGAAGYSYGCNDIWQMYSINQTPTLNARTDWQEAIHLPGSTHMKYMKELLEIFPWQKMTTDTSILLNENPKNESYIVSAIGKKKDFILAYTPFGKPINLDLSKINAQTILAYWYNPRSGKAKKIGKFSTATAHEFIPWSTGRGSDFVLVVIDIKATYTLTNFK